MLSRDFRISKRHIFSITSVYSFHRRLGPFPIDSQVGNGAYSLCLPPSMSRLRPIFNVVKLSLAPLDSIPGRQTSPPPLLKIVDGEEEWVVEEILDSQMVNWKLRYLVKWEGFGVEHNSWEPWDNVHVPELVADFYRRHLLRFHPIHVRFHFYFYKSLEQHAMNACSSIFTLFHA